MQELQQSAPPPTRSTTTTTASQTILYSQDEVKQIVAEKLVAQDKVYNEKLEQLNKVNNYHKECIEKLLRATWTNPPTSDVICSIF
jgi:hypothetical protein